MATRVQAQKRIRKSVKSHLIDREMTLREFAKELGHDLAVVSKAINHGKYPRVVKKVKEAIRA